MKRAMAVYRCRYCGEVYRFGEFDSRNLRVSSQMPGLYEMEQNLHVDGGTMLLGIHCCDTCTGRIGVADLVGWDSV